MSIHGSRKNLVGRPGKVAVHDLADAMARHEGFYKAKSRAQRNNNPGNMWDGLSAGKTKRIWPNTPTDAKGFLSYPTVEAGWTALYKQIKLDASRGMTLSQFIHKFAPPVENDTQRYIYVVSKATGIQPEQRLKDVLAL